MSEKELKTRLASKLWKKMYKSNFFAASLQSQRNMETALLELLKEEGYID